MKAEQARVAEDMQRIMENFDPVSCHWCPRELPLTALPCCPSPAALGGSQHEGHQKGRVGRVS